MPKVTKSLRQIEFEKWWKKTKTHINETIEYKQVAEWAWYAETRHNDASILWKEFSILSSHKAQLDFLNKNKYRITEITKCDIVILQLNKPTRRQQQLIGLFAQGNSFTKEQIAKMLKISKLKVSQEIKKIKSFLNKTSLSIGFTDQTFNEYCMYSTKGSFISRVNKSNSMTTVNASGLEGTLNHVIVNVKGLKPADLSYEKYKLAKEQESRMQKMTTCDNICVQKDFKFNSLFCDCTNCESNPNRKIKGVQGIQDIAKAQFTAQGITGILGN